MKRALLILSIFFLCLWVAGLFYPGRTRSIHIALIVELFFFIHSAIFRKNHVGKEKPGTAVKNQPVENPEHPYTREYNIEAEKAEAKEIRLELTNQDLEAVS